MLVNFGCVRLVINERYPIHENSTATHKDHTFREAILSAVHCERVLLNSLIG